ncbi:MAG: winged helix DNA-binding domain-containing protein [Propionicimonas sp.]
MDRDDVLSRRLATQRLTGPAADTPAEIVRELLCVQAQDPTLAKAMLALRSTPGSLGRVETAVASGEIVRTHVLRPTWHYVAAEDLVWLLELTSGKVESAMAARHRQLRLDGPVIGRAAALFHETLAGHRFATRATLGRALAEAGVVEPGQAWFGQQVGHLLLLGELHGQLCSAPTAATEHHYALVDEVVAPALVRTRSAAITELVGRFIAGHGPVALTDLQRWTRLTLAEVRGGLAELGDRVASVTIDGIELWHAPTATEATRPQRAWLLSTFDEAFLTYKQVGFPRSPGHLSGEVAYRFAEAGGGPVICDLRDVGGWKRTLRRGVASLNLTLDPGLDSGQRSAIDEAAAGLLAAIAS